MESGKHMNKNELTYKLKRVFCQDPTCSACAGGKGHGPYWHAIVGSGHEKRTVFLGKHFKPFAMEKESENDGKTRQPSNDSHHENRNNIAENRFSLKTKQKLATPVNQTTRINSPKNLSVPSRSDFERDLHTLKTTLRAANLKSIYRKLTKKYHPDNYPGISHITAWMAEINGLYCLMKKTASF